MKFRIYPRTVFYHYMFAQLRGSINLKMLLLTAVILTGGTRSCSVISSFSIATRIAHHGSIGLFHETICRAHLTCSHVHGQIIPLLTHWNIKLFNKTSILLDLLPFANKVAKGSFQSCLSVSHSVHMRVPCDPCPRCIESHGPLALAPPDMGTQPC